MLYCVVGLLYPSCTVLWVCRELMHAMIGEPHGWRSRYLAKVRNHTASEATATTAAAAGVAGDVATATAAAAVDDGGGGVAVVGKTVSADASSLSSSSFSSPSSSSSSLSQPSSSSSSSQSYYTQFRSYLTLTPGKALALFTILSGLVLFVSVVSRVATQHNACREEVSARNVCRGECV